MVVITGDRTQSSRELCNFRNCGVRCRVSWNCSECGVADCRIGRGEREPNLGDVAVYAESNRVDQLGGEAVRILQNQDLAPGYKSGSLVVQLIGLANVGQVDDISACQGILLCYMVVDLGRKEIFGRD